MADVFLSYKREDWKVAQQLAEVLATEGLDVWWDAELRGGNKFDRRIREEIDNAGSVVVLWSYLALASDYVVGEARYAYKRDKLISIAIEEFDFEDLPFDLQAHHIINLSTWRGDKKNKEFSNLVRSIDECINTQNIFSGDDADSDPYLRFSVKKLKSLAQNGDSEAMFNLAGRYHYDTDTEMNLEKAYQWYLKAADKKHCGAMLELGNMYSSGIGVRTDKKEAQAWYRKALEAGSVVAQIYLDSDLEEGGVL